MQLELASSSASGRSATAAGLSAVGEVLFMKCTCIHVNSLARCTDSFKNDADCSMTLARDASSCH